MARFRPGFHNNLAAQFIDDVFYNRRNLYMSLGKIDPWAEYTDNNVPVNVCDCECPDCVNKNGTFITVDYGDNSNPHRDPGNEECNETEIRNSAVYFSRLGADSISCVTKAHRWAANTYYSQWDNTKDMTDLPDDEPFFVYNSRYEVFKCLYNNKSMEMEYSKDEDGNIIKDSTGHAVVAIQSVKTPSMYEPNGVNYDVITTADGYVWKYMYTIPMTLREKFASSTMIPVQRAVQAGFYNRGAIEEINVLDPGEGYLDERRTLAVVDVPRDSNGDAVPDGVPATLDLQINPDTGSIDSVIITNRGSGYTSDPPIEIKDQEGGRGKFGNPSAILRAHIFNGELDYVTIEDPGVGYSGESVTTIAVVGDGSGCTAYPKIVDGRIVGVVVTNPGQGYTYADISANISSSRYVVTRKADFSARIGGEIIINEQSVVEQTAKVGAIYAIDVIHPGESYSTATKVIVDGDGTGCTAHAVIKGGYVSKIVVDEPGENYTYATVRFEDELRPAINTYLDASAYVILPPTHGHGYDAISELYAHTVALSTTIRNDNVLANLDQEFRQFALYTDIRTIKEKTLAKKDYEIVTFDIRTAPSDAINGLTKDTIVHIGKTPYMIVDCDLSSGRFSLIQISYIRRNIKVGDHLVYDPQDGAGIISLDIEEVNKVPEIDVHSGIMLYSNNNTPFFMADNKTFGIRTYIKF